MSDAAEYSIIHRKAKVARDEFDAREMSPAKALRLSMAKTSEALFQLALVVRTIEQVTVPLRQMEASLGEGGLLIVLDGADNLNGAVQLDQAFVASLIEVQLIGQLRTRLPEPRVFTHTDAAITQPLINELLVQFHQILSDEGIDSGAEGLRFGDMVEDARSLVLGLEAADFELYRLNIDIGPGNRTGMVELYLPHRPPASEDAEADDLGEGLALKLQRAAMTAPVTLNAALTRLRLPLSQVLAWQPGITLPIEHNAISDGVLLGARDHEVARFKLGQFDGFRAVQLISDAAPEEEEEAPADPALLEDANEDATQTGLPTALDAAGSSLPSVEDISGEALEPGSFTDETLGEDDWPALDGLEDVADDLDEMFQDSDLDDLGLDPVSEDDGAVDDFEPLPMVVADIDLNE